MRLFLCCLFLFLIPAALFGQIILTEVPSPKFREITMRLLDSGEFDAASVALNDDLRSAVKLSGQHGQQRYYLDSICYWTMYGEIFYQLGRYDEALVKFDTALQVYFEHFDWLKQITANGQPRQLPRQPAAWGTSKRLGGVGDFRTCRFFMSHKNFTPANPDGGAQPGVRENRTDSRIHADDIVQCLALLIRRRGEILGSFSRYDPQTKRLADILADRPCLPNHFTGTWVDVLYGLVLSAMQDDGAAETNLNRGLLMLNAYDHHLTATALNELGNIALRDGKSDKARDLYIEASFDASMYNQPILLGETLRNAANAQRLTDPTKRCPAIEQAFPALNGIKNVSPLTIVPLLLEMADYEIEANRLRAAVGLCSEAEARMKGTRLMDSLFGAKQQFLLALVDYRNAYANFGNRNNARVLQSGHQHLETALTTARHCSLRLFQLAALEKLFINGLITVKGPLTDRIADDRFEELLRVSTDADWVLNPLDCWTMLVSVPPQMYERWIALSIKRGNKEKAFDIAERSKNARYLSVLPFGEARLSAFRQLLDTPEELLPKDLLVLRQAITLRFREYAKLAKEVKKIRADLAGLKIVPKNADDRQRQAELCKELAVVSEKQELLLYSMALTRQNVPPLYPPIVPLEQIRKALPNGTAMLVYTECFDDLYGFLVGSDGSLSMWQVEPQKKEKTLEVQIQDYLKALGNRNINQMLALKELTEQDAKWKSAGASLLTMLLGHEKRQADFKELVIIPSGILWYLPFDTLCVEVGEKKYFPILTAGDAPLKIRYAPTAALGMPKQSGKRVNSDTLVLLGKLKSSETLESATDAFERFKKSGITNLVALGQQQYQEKQDIFSQGVPASVFSSLIPNLVVLDEIPPLSTSTPPLDWTPFQGDKAKKKNPITTWLPLPYGCPQLVVLPAFHTAAENGLKDHKRSSRSKEPFYEASGDDLFLSSMLLEACGAETILMSRWRTGGRSSFDLTEQFLKGYTTMSAADAWRRAILSVGSSPLVLAEEPRVKEKESEDKPIANHPFFWGGYILIDRGEVNEAAEAKKEETL